MNQKTTQIFKRATVVSTVTLALILMSGGGTAIAAETQTAMFETSAASNLALGSAPWGDSFPGIPDPEDIAGKVKDGAGKVKDGFDKAWNKHTRGCAGNGFVGGLAGAPLGPGWIGAGATAGCVGGWD